jgi:hypothetical protein
MMTECLIVARLGVLDLDLGVFFFWRQGIPGILTIFSGVLVFC